MKSGVVALIGRPNVGKSTLLNNLLGQKVSITSPKPQTTRFIIQAVYEDTRGQIIFLDTPGIFAKVKDPLSKKINATSQDSVNGELDLIVYVADHTRERSVEENKVLGLIRKSDVPKIMVINKSDIKSPTHIVQYKFMEEEFNEVIEVSAKTHKNLNTLLDLIYQYLPEGKPVIDTSLTIQPGINLTSETFLAEIIREKAFLFLRKEVPYSLTTVIDKVEERENGTLYVKARILTSSDKYKIMIIGSGGRMIKEISMAARKELETARGKKVFLELTVETNPHWMDFV